jgi:hypothetical protein
MICHDTPSELFKICQCNESLVCNSCLKKMNKEKISICPICREFLRIEVIYNRKDHIINIFTYLSFLTVILFVQMYPILDFISINNSTNTSLFYNKSFQYLTVYSTTFLIQPLTLLYIINFFKDRNQSQIINKDGILYLTFGTLISFIFDMIMYSSNIDEQFFVYYLSGVNLPFFTFPFAIMFIKLLCEYIFNFNENMIKKSNKNKIKPYQVLSI